MDNIIYSKDYNIAKHYKNFRNLWRGIMGVNIGVLSLLIIKLLG